MRTIYYTTRFIKEFKKLPEAKKRLAIKREKLFRVNPFSTSLRTHKLSGPLEGYWTFSITYQDRVLFRFVSPTEVIFYKIGSHDIYN